MTSRPAATAVSARLPLLPPFHVGNDICRIPRVYRILASARRGPRFVRRVLTAEERRQPRCRAVLGRVLGPPAPGDFHEEEGGVRDDDDDDDDGDRDGALKMGEGRRQERERERELELRRGQVDPLLWKAAEFMAGRFAAKEAAIKAHPHRRLTFHRIAIVRRADVVAAAHHHQRDRAEEKEEGGQEGEEGSGGDDDVRSSGPPLALIKGDDAEGGGGGGGGGGRFTEDCYASISISHDGDYATAVCLGLAP